MIEKNISEILIEQGSLSAEKVQELAALAQAKQMTLEEYLKQSSEIKAEDLARAYATKFELPLVLTISEKMANADLLSKIPLRFLREHAVMPLILESDPERVCLVTADPQKVQPLDELALIVGPQVFTAVAPRAVIIEAINRYYPLEGSKQMIEDLAQEQELAAEVDFGAIGEDDILGMASDAPIIKLINHIFYQAVKRGASDIHIEPYEKEIHVRYRIDGILYMDMMPPKRAQSAIASRIKIMAGLNIAEKRLTQDGRIQLKIADKAIDIRVSILPVTFGERIVMRLLDKTRTFGQLSSLGFSERDYGVMRHCIEQPNGILLITGPTGSGKTSTLYSILSELNTPEVNIVTVEDPVEYQMMGIGQVQVKAKIGLTFAAALRSILRQDPDIVMIGETRDQETAQIAIQAALTGHFVLSTLHTNSAPATITRLIDMGVEPFLIASSVVAVIAQRLVRRLCPVCKEQYKPDPEILKTFGLTAQEAEKITFYRAKGCVECLETGYKGRVAVFEVMTMTHAISRLTIERADTALIQRQARQDGMTLLMQDGLRKIIAGLTTVDEVLAETAVPEGLEKNDA